MVLALLCINDATRNYDIRVWPDIPFETMYVNLNFGVHFPNADLVHYTLNLYKPKFLYLLYGFGQGEVNVLHAVQVF